MSEYKHDLIIVGAGPAGLSASISAESERVNTLILDAGEKPGGQAGTSSFIENYAGFPDGISGAELMGRFIDQALRFTTEFEGPTRVNSITPRQGEGFEVRTEDGDSYLGGAVLIACGVEYRILRARNLSAYLGRGANYGSPDLNVSYENKRVVVVGGANSAGQAACHLASFEGCQVKMFIRGDSIERGMSGYLIDKINALENVEVTVQTELKGVDGEGCVETVFYKQSGHDEEYTCEADEIFVMIGSEPRTLWLPELEKDDRGFIVSGSDISEDGRAGFIETTKGRAPLAHETSMPGVFTAGDVRCGTDKRVALAAGDGAGVVPDIHRFRSYITGN
jgi:thioredoxin reductase (NADPH)